MKGALALRNPCGTAVALNTGSTSVTNSAYVEIEDSTTSAYSAICVTNQGAQPLALAVGAAGSEVLTGIVIPPADAVIVPREGKKSKRLSLISLGGTQSSGYVTLSYFQ